MLAELRAGEFIYEQSAVADTEYVFKHALTQEVAYNSLLIERRKLLHERAGQALESMFAGQLDDHLTQLAHHYSRSDNISKAVEYLGRAGQQALQRSVHVEAISSFTAAIDLLQRLPESPERNQGELVIQQALGTALIALKGYAASEVERAFARALELCERLGDPVKLFPAMFGLWAVHYLRGERRKAFELAEQLLRRAERARDQELLMLAHVALGDTSCSTGELLRAREHLEVAISLYNRERPPRLGGSNDLGVNALSYAALTLWLLGYPDQALERSNEAFALAEAISHPHTLAFAEFFVGRLLQLRRNARETQEIEERLIALSAEHGFTFWLAQATIERGGAMAEQGRHEEGIALMQEGLTTLHAAGPRAQYLCLLVDAYRKTGRINDGLGALSEVMSATDEDEERWGGFEPELHRLKGELLLKKDDSDAAEARHCFQRAIETARNRSAKSWELRATMSLARLLAKQDRREEGRAMLVDIYGWFTEGFDTADLKDAGALLDELSE